MSDSDRWRTRAYVHLLSNRIVLAGEEFERHYREIASGRYPPSLIPRFMHEATHHATFHLSLCTALCFEWSNAERSILDPGSKDNELGDPAKRFVLSMHLQRALSPLLEGMACFAEFDLAPGRSNILSQPSSMLATLLALGRLNLDAGSGGIHIWSNDSGDAVTEAQSRARREPEFLAARAHFLASSYDPLRGPHLFGYVFFKALWRTAKAQTKSFEDPELFLTFVLEHVFADAEAIARVLEPVVKVQSSLKLVLDRVSVRLREIACEDVSAAADRLDRERGKRQKSEVEALLEQRMNACLDSTRAMWSEQSDEATLARRQAKQIAFRDYVSLGALRVTVVYDGGATVTAKNAAGDSLQEAVVFDGSALQAKQEGWLELVFAPYRYLLAAVISLDKQGPVAAAMLLREAEPGELEEVLGAYPGCIESFEADARLSFDVCMSDATRLITIEERKGARDELVEWVKETYCDGLDLELFGEASELWQLRCVLSPENGFAAILDESELRALAAAGTYIPGDTRQNWLHAILGKDTDKVLTNLARKLEGKLATPLITERPWLSWL